MSSLFPQWMNAFPTAAAIGGAVISAGVVGGVWYYFTPSFWEVGYMPEQPVNYSHQLHAGTLGIDCRYCHSNVEDSMWANVPDVDTCMNCHRGEGDTGFLNFDLWQAHKKNENLVKVRESYASGEPIQWRRVHKLPDYVQFNHAAHVNSGVSCFSCHGRVDQMAVVYQEQNLAMAWCLDCHRNPEGSLVDTEGVLGEEGVAVTNLGDVAKLLDPARAKEQQAHGMELAEFYKIQPPEHCAACHY